MLKFTHRNLGCGAALLASSVVFATVSSTAMAAGEVNVYSFRQPSLVKPLFDAFTKKSGIKVNVVFAKKGLIERAKAEGANSPVDIFLTADVGRVSAAEQAGVTQKVNSKILDANVPASYRDPKGHWYGVTLRSRVIYASKARVKQQQITYEELADPKWKGKICVRSGGHPYNIGLIASMIAHHGEAKTESWLRGFKNNLARKPSGNDRAQVKGVYSSECDIALGNNYYMGKMETNEKKPEQKEWAKSVRLIFPNTQGRGTHMNLSAMALAKHAPHKANAIKLMEFLASDEGQKLYAEANFEYPVKEGTPWSARTKSWGTFKFDKLPLADIIKNRGKASKMVDKVQFNDGPSS